MKLRIDDFLVPVAEGSVFVRRWRSGRDKSTPIILLHDSLGSVGQWREFPDKLAQATGREVVAYDRLGYGMSTLLAERPSVRFIHEEAERFVYSLLPTLGLANVILFGHSAGGSIALNIAALLPERCKAVISESAQAFVNERSIAGIREAMAGFEDPRQFEKLARWHGPKTRWVLDAWAGVWEMPEFHSWNMDNILPKVNCPVLVIHGEQDEFGSDEFPRRIVEKTGGPSECAIFANCGHVPHRQRPDDVLRLTADFLAERC